MIAQALLRRYLVTQRGTTAIEYGLVSGIIAVAVVSVAATGGAVDALYNSLLEIVAGLAGGGGDDGGSG